MHLLYPVKLLFGQCNFSFRVGAQDLVTAPLVPGKPGPPLVSEQRVQPMVARPRIELRDLVITRPALEVPLVPDLLLRRREHHRCDQPHVPNLVTYAELVPLEALTNRSLDGQQVCSAHLEGRIWVTELNLASNKADVIWDLC